MNKLEQKVKRRYRIAEKTKSWFQKKKGAPSLPSETREGNNRQRSERVGVWR
jgi:hypothetical protein